jgi:hypothetical protein
LKRSPNSIEIKAGKSLELLFKKRKEADYSYGKTSTNFTNLNVLFYIKASKELVNTFEN